jgi:CBS domain containing-hemolysin-like protein
MFAGTVVFFALLLLDALVAFIRAAFVNSHHAKLRSMMENDTKRAALTIRVAEDARRLLFTFGDRRCLGRV